MSEVRQSVIWNNMAIGIREGKDALFRDGGSMAVNLVGYAIVPLEMYYEQLGDDDRKKYFPAGPPDVEKITMVDENAEEQFDL